MSLPISICLPDGFLEEEIRCGYTVTKNMKKVWAVELDLLVKFLEICKKYNIRYFATSGTLLGAVRHKGFIPWDDDIDVAMLREDYEKFIAVAQNELSYPYFLQTPKTDINYFRGHIQLRNSETTGILSVESESKLPFNQGIFIDIFPLDKMPDSKFIRRNYLLTVKLLNKYIKAIKKPCYNDFKKELVANILKFSTKIWSEERIVSAYDSLCDKYNQKEMAQLSHFSLNFGEKNCIWDVDWYQKTVELQFEFIKLDAPISYDLLLTKIYGDYMTFKHSPTVHGEVIFDTEKSYKSYF